MAFEKIKPYRDARYLAYVRDHSCCSCLRAGPSEPHHFMEGDGGMGRKVDDTFTVPLCRQCHQCWHTEGTLPSYRDSQSRRTESIALIYQNQAMLLGRWIRLHVEDAF